MSYMTITVVTKYDKGMISITVTTSCNIKKDIRDSKIDNIIAVLLYWSYIYYIVFRVDYQK